MRGATDVGGAGWEANLRWGAWGAGKSGGEMSNHVGWKLGAASCCWSLVSVVPRCCSQPKLTQATQTRDRSWAALGLWGGRVEGRYSPAVGSRKGGPGCFWGTRLRSQFSWPLTVGPLFYIYLDYVSVIDNFGPWIYNDTHFLTQRQDDIFHLLKLLLLGGNFQFCSYRSCTLLLSLFPVFFNLFCCYWVFKKIVSWIYYFCIFISACYFCITALNSIGDTFPWILMSYKGKHALMQ